MDARAALAEQEQSLILSSELSGSQRKSNEDKDESCCECCRTYGYTYFGLLILIGVPLIAFGIVSLFSYLFTGELTIDHRIHNWTYTSDKYEGDSDWPGYYCSHGVRQSPINIPTHNILPELDNTVPPLEFRNLVPPTNVTMLNTKSTVELHVPPHAMIKLSGGQLDGDYALFKVIIHWSLNDYAGSEHQVGGRSYPVELQFIFAKVGYVHSALLRMDDGYVGVSVLGEHDFRYYGSSTRPKCRENMLWLVMKHPISIDQQWLATIRQLRGPNGENVTGNSRPIKPINGRVVMYKNSGEMIHATLRRQYYPSKWRTMRARRRNWRNRIGNLKATHVVFRS